MPVTERNATKRRRTPNARSQSPERPPAERQAVLDIEVGSSALDRPHVAAVRFLDPLDLRAGARQPRTTCGRVACIAHWPEGTGRCLVQRRGGQPETGANSGRPLWLHRVDEEVEALFRRESVGLVAGERAEGLAVLLELGRVFGKAPASVTEALLPKAPCRRWEELAKRLAGCPLLFDLEALCWDRGLGLDPNPHERVPSSHLRRRVASQLR